MRARHARALTWLASEARRVDDHHHKTEVYYFRAILLERATSWHASEPKPLEISQHV